MGRAESLKLSTTALAALIAKLGPERPTQTSGGRRRCVVADGPCEIRARAVSLADDLPQLGPDAAEGFDDSLLTAELISARSSSSRGRVVFRGGGGGGDVVGEILARTLPDLDDFQRQIDARVPPMSSRRRSRGSSCD